MKLLFKDQLRKIKQNLFNFISLSLLVMIIALTFTGVKSSVRRLDANYDTYLQEQNIEDFYFSMGKVDINYLGGTAINRLCKELDLQFECAYAYAFPNDPSYLNELNVLINDKIQERPDLYETLIESYVAEFIDEYDYEVEKMQIINVLDGDFIYKFTSVNETINIPYLVEGTLPVNDFEISIFPEFAAINEIEIGDTLKINNKEYLVVGFHYQPEFLFPIFNMSKISFDPSIQTLILCNENTIQDLDQYIFVKYLVKGDLTQVFGDFGYDTIQTADKSALGKNMQLVHILMPKEINFRIITLPTEIENANAFIDIFLPMFIGFVTILLLVFMKRYIDRNKKDIFTLHALGYTNNEIALSLLLYPLLISLTSIIGYGFGLLLSNRLFDLYSARYLFPKAGFEIYTDILLYAIVVPIVTIVFINYFFILYNLNRKEKTIKKFKIRLLKFTPIKTIFTSFLLFFTISIMIVFGLNGNTMFSAFIDETKLGNNFEELINLQYMTDEEYDEDYESFTKVFGKIHKVNDHELDPLFNTALYGIDPGNELKLLINNTIENNQLLEEGIIISDYLSTALDLSTGDSLTIEIGGVIEQFEIMGVSNELIENNIFIKKEVLNSFYRLDNTFYNGLYITDQLYESDYITSRIDYQNSLEEFASVVNVSSLILNLLLILSISMSLFIFVLVIVSYFTDNKINIAILKSVGHNNKEINQKYLISFYIILVVSFTLSVPITSYLLNMMLETLMDTVGFKLILKINYFNILLGFTVLNIIFFFISRNINKYYDEINISEVLKSNIK